MNERKPRENFPAEIIRTVAQRAAYLCSKPDCRCLTTTAALGQGVDRVGEAAHIIAATPDGPRGKQPLDKHGIPDVKSLENALWLCSIHHKQIDSHPEDYPVEMLLAWKADVEDFTRRHLGRNPFQPLPGALPYTPPLLPDPSDLPAPASLPPGSYLPRPQNQAFTGRMEELHVLARHLLYDPHNRPAAIVQKAALSGSGGIGKTQVAVEFCYRYGQFFYGVHWLQADQPLDPQLAACGEKMQLSPWPEAQPEQVRLTLQAWARQPHRLLVLDNLTDPQMLRNLPEELRLCKLLLTSRRADYDPTLGVRTYPLELLPRPDSLALLRKLAPRLEQAPEAELDKLAARLGDYPLALHLAGMYLHLDQRSTPQSYLKKLDAPGSALNQEFLQEWKRKNNPTHYEHNAGEAFLLSWEQLNPEVSTDALARRFFLAAGCCAANTPIPLAVFSFLGGQEASDLQCASALDRLQALGLAAPTHSGPLLHPLLAEFAQVQDAAEKESALPDLVAALTKASDQADKIGAVEGMRPLLPHLRQAGENYDQDDAEKAALMFSWLGSLLQDMGDYPAAQPYYEQALAIRRETLGEKHPDTAQSLNNLGMLFQEMGDYPAALGYYEQALVIWREVLGEKHPLTATSLNNLGLLLKRMGDYPAARGYYEQALAIKKEILGDKHPSLATSLNNLGSLLQDMGDYPAARPYLEQALAIVREVLGEKHPTTASSLNNLGMLLQAMGDLPAARGYYEQAMAIRREVLGDKHPDTAQSLNNLGSLLQDMGDLPAARPYLEQALAIRREVLGEKHPTTATSLNNLGGLLYTLGDYPAARGYYEQALAIDRAALGEKHPGTATDLNNLGTLLQDMGDLPAARGYLEQALAIRRQVLGEKHPSLANSLNNLGSLLYTMGDLPAARPYLEQALAIFEATLGPDHPNTLIVRRNLASLPPP